MFLKEKDSNSLLQENDLDQKLEQLEKAEKNMLEKENAMRVAKEDARNLAGEIALKESKLTRAKEGLEVVEKQLTAVAARYIS
jgi:hypothetical protein